MNDKQTKIDKQTDIYLISPPCFLTPSPLMGVHLLKAYLEKQDMICHSVDLNIRFLHWLINESTFLNSFSEKYLSAFAQPHFTQALPDKKLDRFLLYSVILGITPPAMVQRWFPGSIISQKDNIGNISWKSSIPSALLAIFLTNITDNNLPFQIQSETLQDILVRRIETFNAFLSVPEIDTIIRKISESLVVGISASIFFPQSHYSFMLAERIKKYNPKAYIIIGGAGLSVTFKHIKHIFKTYSPHIDAIGLYEGELTLEKLIKALKNGHSTDGVPNLVPMHSIMKFEDSLPPYEPPPHLNTIPPPSFNPSELSLYGDFGRTWWPETRLPLLVSRGCWWDKCAYCVDSKCRHPKTPPYQPVSPEKAVCDVEHLQNQYGADYIYLITTAMAPQWGTKFAEKIVEKKIKAKFWTYFRAAGSSQYKEGYFNIFKKAGFDFITCGVESTVDHVLQTIQKGNTRDDISHTINAISKSGINFKFMLIYDLPPSTVSDAQENWDFIIKNIPKINDLTVFKFNLLDGSIMADSPEKYGIEIKKRANGLPLFTSAGVYAHTNPFYNDPGAAQWMEKFKNLDIDIQFFHHTKSLRKKLQDKSFNWDCSSFVFHPVSAVPLRDSINIFQDGNFCIKDAYIVFLKDFFRFAVFPKAYKPFIELILNSSREYVTFPVILQIFKNCHSNQDDNDIILQKILTRMVYEGYVRGIKNQSDETGSQDTGEYIFNPKKDLLLSFPQEQDQMLPVHFGSLPFAMIPGAKMS